MPDLIRFVVWVLTTWGLIYLVTQSVIFRGVRGWLADQHPLLELLVYCPSCTGFWAALVSAALLAVTAPPLPPSVLFEVSLLQWIAAAISGGLSGCALGSLWATYGPPSVWEWERANAKKAESDDEDST